MTVERPLSDRTAHICVDMQKMFMPPGPWAVSWLPATLPMVIRLVEKDPSRTVFTRFIPARRPGDGHGMWRSYFHRWQEMTLERAGTEIIELAPPLGSFVPPARTFDKPVYSPWFGGDLARAFLSEEIDTLVISGGEADMCVLATVMGAIDLGFRVVLAEDAICSTSDVAYENILKLFNERYSHHVEVGSVEEILDWWK
ncbi:cysteine hydrolase [Mesorhizobium sp. BH1-1-5]|uniref:cysteine hydrolase family protein n=1 Tax=Mesorhizobium sp. BH1-1-5 TaxID=2876661 RepID=UPI001CCD2ACD|nr:isochorismatase family cysteine hydrolase [Mesorhizobium sp. BH1-1-5]MBZ9986854.1 cysteine hydrolase [Mesorhizobium sp. BH1-1-5]